MRARHLVCPVAAILLATACVADDDAPVAGAGETTAADDWEPEFVDGVLQPLPDGFPDRPITIVVVDEAGSRDGLYARSLDAALDGMSPVDVVVSDKPSAQGGTFGALTDVLTRDGGGDGYFTIVGGILGVTSDLHVEPIEDELGIGIEDVTFLISTETHPYVFAQRADAPWGVGFDAFVQYTQEHPGEVRYLSGGVGGGQDITMEWLLANLDLEVTKVPAADRDAAMAAVGAGEGDVTLTQPDVALPAEETGRADVILATSEEVPAEWTDNEGVVSAKDFADLGLPEGTTWGAVLGLLVPSQVNELHQRWLYALFEAASEAPAYQARADSIPGLQIRLYSTEEANELARATYESTEPIIRELGLHHEDS